MIVVIAGMQRSGSTYCFNLVRELLLVRGGVNTLAVNNFEEVLRTSQEARHLLVKSHHPDHRFSLLIKKGAALTICTIRKPEDSVASWMKTFGFDLEHSVSEIKQWLQWHRQLSDSVLNISFDCVERHPLRVAFKIGRQIRPWPFPIEIYKLKKKYEKASVYEETMQLSQHVGKSNIENIGFSYYDRTTFFHRRHVSTPSRSKRAVDLLPMSQVELIRRELSEFVNSAGFYHW